ncbi:MAG: lysophospholipid acyltransferase family protein [Rubrivivax sp.]
MRLALAFWRLLRAVVHVLHGMAVMAFRFPSLDAVGRQARIGWWARGLLRALGIGLRLQGRLPIPAGPALLVVANHVSWLDIAAIHAVLPQARFVSKADVLQWPLLGWLIRGAGTLFIERERKRDAVRVVHAMRDALAAGNTVAVFPEGATASGPELLPFHGNLLQAAISTATPVLPVVLRFADAASPFSAAAPWVGDTSLLQSLWRVASARGLCVHLDLLAPVPTAQADRRHLAADLRRRIQNRLPTAEAPPGMAMADRA